MTVQAQLHRLIYCSRQFAETRQQDAHIEVILDSSRRNNARDGLTGLLVSLDGWFLQTLEGPAWAVNATYNRILFDPRHYDPQVLTTGPVEERAFGRWSMCARRLSPADAAVLTVLRGSRSFDPTRLDADEALPLLRAIADLRTPAAA